jgi:acylphosphatase
MGVNLMPTIKSYFNFQQFQKVLQKLAHEIALEAVKNLNQGDVRIVIHGSRLDTVETDKAKIRFYARHIGYYEEPTRNYKDWWGFDVEEKFYLTSNHCTKISFYAPEGKGKEIAEKITGFIDKIMAESSIKPIPRFSLAQTTNKRRAKP